MTDFSNAAKILMRVLTRNELGGNTDLAYEFSDPDGVRTGKSGYSFGPQQYDLINNPEAAKCLAACGFTAEEIQSLIKQTCDSAELYSFNRTLLAHKSVIDAWAVRHMQNTVDHVLDVIRERSLSLGGPDALEVLLHLCDYDNQFHIDLHGKCADTMAGLGRPIMAADVLRYKLTTAWATVHHRTDDVYRRFGGVVMERWEG